MWMHFIVEILCGAICIAVFLLSYPLYLHNKDFTSLHWFSMWGLWLGFLTLTHAIAGITCENTEIWITFTNLPERVGYSIIVMLCVYPGQSKETILYGLKRKIWIFGVFFALFIMSVYYGAHSTLDMINEDFIIGRPQEIIPLIVSCVVFGRLIDATTVWSKILRWGVFSTIFGCVFMMFSHRLYDWQFIIAYSFKFISYLFMLYAIMYLLKTVCKKISCECGIVSLLKGQFL